MKRNDFDARLAHHLRSIGRETCSEADVHEYALMSIANAAALAFYMKTEPTVIHCPAADEVRAGRLQRPVRPGRTSVTTSRANGLTQI